MKVPVFLIALAISGGLLVGCTSLAESTNTLSDERIQSMTAGVLGYEPADMTIVNRRTEGTNTYANLRAADGREFTCIINGGNLMSMGMTNPPSCSRKGEPVRSSPLQL